MQESHGAIAESDIADTNGADCENYKKGLGNLTLLVKPINIVVSNDFYELKTPAYKKKRHVFHAEPRRAGAIRKELVNHSNR
jgi:hypothetical protein